MKHFFFSLLLCCFPCASFAQGTIFIGASLDEYVLSTPDKKCILNYLSPQKIPESWSIQTATSGCAQNGFRTIQVMDETKTVRDTLSGYFTNHYFVGAAPLNTPVVKRVNPTPLVQDAYYLIDQDQSLGISYVGKMTASAVKSGFYPAFNVCEPFQIIAVTANKKLFEKEDTLQNLVTVVKSYAQTICPNVTNIVFMASGSEAFEKDIFSQIYLEKAPDSSWSLVSDKSFNAVTDEKQTELQKQALVQKTYGLLEGLPPYDRPAFLFGEFKIDFPAQLVKAATTLDMPVKGVFILHVKEDQSWADKPFAMAIEPPLLPGWHLVQASVTPLSIQEKKKAGISLGTPGAKVHIEKSQTCTLPACAEWEETAYVLEKKYMMPRRMFLPKEGTP